MSPAITPDYEIDAFVKSFAKDLEEGNVAIFAGAGMSRSSGYVDWRELMRDIANDLGLRVELEHDLISLAQFHVNYRGTSDGLARRILEEFSDCHEPSLVHQILARLPIRTYWTTNYDTLIEEQMRRSYRVPDVKSSVDHLTTARPKRDAVVYKMHGDVSSPREAILYKEQYEKYHRTHAAFITALSGDLVSKTFLFIGFSFSDPNLDYVLSRLHDGVGKRTHYCFMKAADREEGDDDEAYRYKIRKQELWTGDLKRFGIQTLLVRDYADIPKILQRVEDRFRKKTVFISGSAEQYGSWDRNEALSFIHTLSAKSIGSGLRVVNGFGWGVGSAVINGALEKIYGDPQRYSESQLIVRPFPQHGNNLADLWEEYRQRMISLAGVAVFVFGNKVEEGEIVNAGGVRREFEIAVERGLVPIPVGATGYMAEELWREVLAEPGRFYEGIEWIVPLIKELGDKKQGGSALAEHIIEITRRLTRN